jgi:hypothetical protein
MSIIRTFDRSTAYANNGFLLRKSGVTRSRLTPPSLVATGTAVGGTTAATSVAWPAGHVPGDLGILVWECSGNGTTVTPSGWEHFSGSPVVDIADATGSKLNVAWRFATSSAQANASIPNTGDHVIGQIFVYRNVTQAVKPGRAYVTDAKTTASFVLNFPAVNTVAPNSRIIGIASRPDDSASTTNFTGYTNTTLSTAPNTFFGENTESGTVNGNGGGYVVWSGTMSNVGSSGQTSATSVVQTTNAYFVFALEPSLALPA